MTTWSKSNTGISRDASPILYGVDFGTSAADYKPLLEKSGSAISLSAQIALQKALNAAGGVMQTTLPASGIVWNNGGVLTYSNGKNPSPELAQFAVLASTIATTAIPALMMRFATNGYSAAKDFGRGAVYVRAASGGGPGAVQDSTGAWFQIDVEAPGCGPHWFGAVGDGTTVDTTALSACATACAGNVINFLPGKTYKISSTISIPANTVLLGYGATITTSSQIVALLFANGGGCFGLKITGPASATYDTEGYGIKCSGTNNSPSAPTFVNAPIIKDCTITNFGSYGVYFAYVNGGSVDNCYISGIGYTGIGGISCNDTTATRNQIADIGPGTAGDAYGIYFSRADGTSEVSEPRSYRCSVTNNDVRSVVVAAGTNGQGIDTHGGVDLVFADNNIAGCQVGIAATSSVISGTPTLGPQRVAITGNVIDGLSVGYGMLISGAVNGATVVEYATGISVVGNTILNHGTVNSALGGAIMLQGTKGSVVSGNTLRRPQSVGINLNASNAGISITGNTITDPHDATFAAPCCLRVSGNDNSGYIGGNTFVYESSGVDTYVAIEALRIASGLTGLSLRLAPCSFVGIDATHLSYQELVSTGVNAEGFYSESGVASLSLSNGTSSTSISVSFGTRFPSPPKIVATSLTGSIFGGNKSPIMTTNTLAATGFNMVAYPADVGNWTASGTLNICWYAST